MNEMVPAKVYCIGSSGAAQRVGMNRILATPVSLAPSSQPLSRVG